MSEKYDICEGTCRSDVLSLDGLHRIVSWEDEVLLQARWELVFGVKESE